MPDDPLDVLLAALDHAETAPRDEDGQLTPEARQEVEALVEYAAHLHQAEE